MTKAHRIRSLPHTTAIPTGSSRFRPVHLRAWRAGGAQTLLLTLLVFEASLGATTAHAQPISFAGSTTLGVDVDPVWSSAWFSHAIDRHNGLGLSLQLLPSKTNQDPHTSTADGPGSHTRQGDETFALVDWTRLLHRWNLDAAQANLWLFAGIGTYHASGSRRQSMPMHDRQLQAHGDAQETAPEEPPVPQPTSPFPTDHSGHSLLSLEDHLALLNDTQSVGTPGAGPGSSAPQTDQSPSTVDRDRNQTQERSVHDVEIISTPAEPALRIAASPGIQVDIETTRLRLEGRGRLFLAPGIQRSQLSATAGLGLTPARYQGVQPWLELQVRAMPGVIDGVEWVPKLRLVQRRMVLEIGYSTLGSLVGGFTFTL